MFSVCHNVQIKHIWFWSRRRTRGVCCAGLTSLSPRDCSKWSNYVQRGCCRFLICSHNFNRGTCHIYILLVLEKSIVRNTLEESRENAGWKASEQLVRGRRKPRQDLVFHDLLKTNEEELHCPNLNPADHLWEIWRWHVRQALNDAGVSGLAEEMAWSCLILLISSCALIPPSFLFFNQCFIPFYIYSICLCKKWVTLFVWMNEICAGKWGNMY